MTNIFLLDGGWLRGNITGHPSSSISSSSTSPHKCSSLESVCHVVAFAVNSLEKKNLKKIQKKTYIVLCTLKCTKNIFCFSNNIVCVYLAFKNKSHCSSDLLLFFFFFGLFQTSIFSLVFYISSKGKGLLRKPLNL